MEEKTYTHAEMVNGGMGRGKRTHTLCTRHRNRGVGLTVDFHMECVIFAVTGAVGTEAKALDFTCGERSGEPV